MKQLIDGYCRVLNVLIVVALAVMVVLVFGNVVLRYGFNSGITVSEEVSRWLFLWLTFLGAVVAVRDHGHLGTDVLVSRLPRAGKRACLFIGQVLMLYVNWLLLKGSWAQTKINLEVEAPVTGASMAIVYATGIVFAILASIVLLHQLWLTVSGQLTDADMVMVQESEDLQQMEELHLDHSLDKVERR